MALRFDDKVVLVTGESRGLGNAFARCLATAGATVAVNSTGKDDGGELATRAIIDAVAETRTVELLPLSVRCPLDS